MTEPKRFESVVAEAPTATGVTAVAAPKAARLELDGDEIVQLSIKPSLWFIPLVSLRALLAVAFVAITLVILMSSGAAPRASTPFLALALLAMLRVAVATLQWASRLYVLTNRRVMRCTGVLSVTVSQYRLSKITGVELAVPWYGRFLGLGSVHLGPPSDQRHATPQVWSCVARPHEIHDSLVRAVRKSQQ